MDELLLNCGLGKIPKVEPPEDLKQIAKDWIKSPKVFLVLWGAGGTYKTTTAKKLLNAYLEKVGREIWNGLFVRFYDIEKFLEEEEYVEILKKTKLLVIDDLVFEGLVEKMWLKLFSIIDTRYEKKRKTLITTNHNPHTQINGVVSYKQRIASRLCDINLSIVYETKASFRNLKGNGGDKTW